MHFYKNTLKIC